MQIPAFQPGAFVQIEGEATRHIERFGHAHHQVQAAAGDSRLQNTLFKEPVAHFQIELPGDQCVEQGQQSIAHELFNMKKHNGEHAGTVGGRTMQHLMTLADLVASCAFQLPDGSIETA